MEQLTTFQKCMIAAGRMSAPDESTTDPKLDKPTNPMYYTNESGEDKPMNILPGLEARMSAQERRQLNSDAHIEEFAKDMTVSMKHLSDDLNAGSQQLAQYHMKTEQQIDERFNQVDARLDKIDEHFNQVDVRLDKMDARLDKMDARFDRVDERFDKVDERLDKVETDTTDIRSTMERYHQETVQVLIQILERLPSP